VHPGTPSRNQLAPVIFRPPRALGVIVGGALAVWAAIVAGLAANLAIGASAELKTLVAWVVAAVMLLIALAFANWTFAVATMAYTIDDEALTITWGWRRVVIPIATIQRMIPGRNIEEPRIEGLNWWGCHVGHAEVPRVGYTMIYSTHSGPEEILYVVTSEGSYGLTVLEQAQFAREIQERALAGPPEDIPQRAVATGLGAMPFWRDRQAVIAAALSALACIALAAYVVVRYPGLPDVVQLEFPSLGGVARFSDKSELLRIAYLGVGILAVNTLVGVTIHARERAAGLWLLASGGMLQLVLLAAAIVAFETV